MPSDEQFTSQTILSTAQHSLTKNNDKLKLPPAKRFRKSLLKCVHERYGCFEINCIRFFLDKFGDKLLAFNSRRNRVFHRPKTLTILSQIKSFCPNIEKFKRYCLRKPAWLHRIIKFDEIELCRWIFALLLASSIDDQTKPHFQSFSYSSSGSYLRRWTT